jgi:malonyl-CoA O-methyltransferase
MEALCELGDSTFEPGHGRRRTASTQRRRRARVSDVEWVCSTGIAQYAVVWYRLASRTGQKPAYLERIRTTRRILRSYGKGAKYIPTAEISWAIKYFLDAHYLKSGSKGVDA